MKKHEKKLAEICISAQVYLMTYYRDTTEDERGEDLEDYMVETIEVLERATERARKHKWSFDDRTFEIVHLTHVLYELREVSLSEANSSMFEELTEYMNRLDKLYKRLTKK